MKKFIANKTTRRSVVVLSWVMLDLLRPSILLSNGVEDRLSNTSNISAVLSSADNVTNEVRVLFENNPDQPFKIITDDNFERSVTIDSSKKVISLKDKEGKTLWSIDIFSKIKEPIIGKAEIREAQLKNGQLLVTIGKHSFATVDLESGAVTFLGSD